MKIIIKETNAVQNLGIIDPRTGICYISDFIGNTGALTDGQFVYDDSQDAYICELDTFDWWDRVVNDNQALEDRIFKLCGAYGSDEVYEVVNNAGSSDLEDHASIVNAALNDAFGG